LIDALEKRVLRYTCIQKVKERSIYWTVLHSM